jgi:hypothetical protein
MVMGFNPGLPKSKVQSPKSKVQSPAKGRVKGQVEDLPSLRSYGAAGEEDEDENEEEDEREEEEENEEECKKGV